MAITSPCYTTREDVMRALDVEPTLRSKQLIDSAVMGATGDIKGLCHRQFYPEDGVKYFDWPNWDYAYPWRLWLYQYDLVVATAITSGGNAIDLDDVFFEPADKEPDEPYTYFELNRSSNESFGQGDTPQHDVGVTGTWGFCNTQAAAGQLAAAMSDTTGTTLLCSDASQVGVGNILTVDSERMIVAERAMTDSGQTLQAPLASAQNSNLASVTTGSDYAPGEVLLIDGERLFITDVAGNNLVVKRGWEGTTLAAHDAAATVYVERLLTVIRGELGTAAATHTDTTAITRHVPPAMITELALAIAQDGFLQKTSGYARTVGAGDTARNASGAGLADLRARVYARYGRKARTATI